MGRVGPGVIGWKHDIDTGFIFLLLVSVYKVPV